MAQGPIRRRIPAPPDGQQREAELIQIADQRENPSVFELADGSVISLRVVVTEIWRVLDYYDESGNPVYVIRSGNMATVTAPETLRRRDS